MVFYFDCWFTLAMSDNVVVTVDKMKATKKVVTDVPNNPPLLNRIPANLQIPDSQPKWRIKQRRGMMLRRHIKNISPPQHKIRLRCCCWMRTTVADLQQL